MTTPVSRSMTDNEVFEKLAAQGELCRHCAHGEAADAGNCTSYYDLHCVHPRTGQKYRWIARDLCWDSYLAEGSVLLGETPADCALTTSSAIPCPHYVRRRGS